MVARLVGFAGIALIVLMIAILSGCGGGNSYGYALTVTKSGTKYSITGKPAGGRFELDFGGVSQWDITNATGGDIQIHFDQFDVPSSTDCGANFMPSGISTCSARVAIPDTQTRSITAVARDMDPADYGTYKFTIFIQPPDAVRIPVDPELEIERDNFFTVRNGIGAGIAGVLLLMVAWWLSRRRRTLRAAINAP